MIETGFIDRLNPLYSDQLSAHEDVADTIRIGVFESLVCTLADALHPLKKIRKENTKALNGSQLIFIGDPHKS